MPKPASEVMGYTHRGVRWETRHSWYLLALLTYWLYWFPLVYTGLRVLRLRWVVWGALYGLPCFLALAFDPAQWGIEDWFRRWTFAAFVVAAIHSLRARGEFLVRLAGDEDEREEIMAQARARRDDAEPSRSEPDDVTAHAEDPPARHAKLLDINLVGERELALLPGMGAERARQAVALRDSLGGYASFEEFAEKIGLAAEVRGPIAALFADSNASRAPIGSRSEFRELADGTRVLELNLASAEALAALPGIGMATAQEAVRRRETDGPYKSVEEFRYRLGIPIEVIAPISALLSTLHGAPEPGAAARPSGRIVDL